MKVTNEMVKYWIGSNKFKEAVRVIKEISNSHRDAKPWTPAMLHSDIIQTWNTNKDTRSKQWIEFGMTKKEWNDDEKKKITCHECREKGE